MLMKKMGACVVLNGDSFYVTKYQGKTKKWFMCVYGPAGDEDYARMEATLKRHGYKETQEALLAPQEFKKESGGGILFYLEPLDSQAYQEDRNKILGQAPPEEEFPKGGVEG